jgi:RNA polymerase sigma factor (TIGR02999 family)
MSASSGDVTQLLKKMAAGDASAREELFRAVEADLRVIANSRLRSESDAHSLQTTALIDDAYIRLIGKADGWEDRKHFYRAAARAMRRILIDYVRRRKASKRGSGGDRVRISDIERPINLKEAERLVALDEAIDQLATFDPRAADVVELHHFGGRSHAEVAKILEISERTAKSDWAAAKAFLHEKLADLSD